MYQWMGGARRKIGATKDSKLKRQREFFDHRKEKQRKTECGEEPRKLHTLADYIRQNLHGGESLDILGLRNLNPTAASACTTENPDVSFPNPANAAVGANLDELDDLAVVTSNISAIPTDVPKEDARHISSQQPESTTRSHRIIEESKLQAHDCFQWTPGVATTAQEHIKKSMNRNTGVPLPCNVGNPIHVGNLQTKKVSPSAPRLEHFDTISNDVRGGNCGPTRSPPEAYAVFSQDGEVKKSDAIDESVFDPVVENPQWMFNFPNSDANLVDTRQLQTPSLQLKKSNESHLGSPLSETSELLSRFLSTQKLKVLKQEDELVNKSRCSQQHERWQLSHSKKKDIPYETDSLPNSFRAANKCRNLNFSNPTFNMTNVEVKQEPSENDFSNAKFDVEDFHLKQEPEEFIFSDPSLIVMKFQEKYSQENKLLNLGSNISDYRMAQDCQYLADLSYDEPAIKVDGKSFDLGKGLEYSSKDPTTWYCGLPSSAASTGSISKREFPVLDHFKLTEIPSSVESKYEDLCQPESYEVSPPYLTRRKIHFDLGITDVNKDNYFDTIEVFSSQFKNEELDTSKFDNLQFPVDEMEFEGHETEGNFLSLDLYSPSQTKTMRGNYGNESSVWNDDMVGKNCTIPEQWNCESSVPWDALRQQEIFDLANSGKNSGQTHDRDDVNSWSDCSTVEVNEIKVDANTVSLPIQSINFPSQVIGNVKSTSGKEQDNNTLPFEAQSNRMFLETADSLECGKDATAAETMSITKLLSGEKDFACHSILTKNYHEVRNCYPIIPISLSCLGKDTEVLSWQIKVEPQREACSKLLQTPKTRISSSNLLPKEREKDKDSPTHCRSNIEMNHSPSKELFEHSVPDKLIHNADEESLEICTNLKALSNEDINDMSTTEGGLRRKQLRLDDLHDFDGRTSFSSQEECSPEFQLRKVQTVLCKLQRPTYSCGSKQGEVSDQGVRNVNTVLFKFQKPTEPLQCGLGLQNPEVDRNTEKNVTQSSNTDQMINSELGTKPSAECEIRLLTDFNIHGSRGSLALPNGGSTCVKRSVSEPINSPPNEDVETKGQCEITKHFGKEDRLSLHHIDTIASTDYWIPDETHQNPNEEKAHSPLPVVHVKEVPEPCASPAEKQNSTSNAQRNSISLKSEKNHLFFGVTDPPARDERQHSLPEERRTAELIVPDEVQSSLGGADAPSTHAGELQPHSNTTQDLNRQEEIHPAHEQHDQTNLQRNSPPPQDFKQDAGSTTYDAAYVKMLESYVVQLKLENNLLRLSSGS